MKRRIIYIRKKLSKNNAKFISSYLINEMNTSEIPHPSEMN